MAAKHWHRDSLISTDSAQSFFGEIAGKELPQKFSDESQKSYDVRKWLYSKKSTEL